MTSDFSMIALPILFILLAGFFKAVADTLVHHFDSSIFRWWNRRFWDASVSWQYAKKIPLTNYPVDGWHLANSAMIFSWCAAVVSHVPVCAWWIEYPAAGVLFIISFNTFYNKILR